MVLIYFLKNCPQEFELFDDDGEPAEYDLYCTWEAWEENMIRYDPTKRGFGEFVYIRTPLIPAVQNSNQEFMNMLIDPTKKYCTQICLAETRKATTAGLANDKR